MRGILIAAAALSLGACQKAEAPAAEESAPTEAAAPVAVQSPDAGTYDVTNPDGTTGSSTLNADGTYKAWAGLPQPSGFPKEAGGLELSGNQLTFRSSDDGLMCRNQSGTYEVVAWSSDELEFALVTDECEGRKGNPNGAWEHVAETDE